MFTVVLEKNLLFYLMTAVGVIGIIGKLVSCMTIRRLTIAAENMSKSEHRLMKLIRAKYEHASMISDKVQNVDAFVDKYLFEYRTGGLKLHTWREVEKQVIWLSGVFALIGAIGSYSLTGMDGLMRYYAIAGVLEMVVLYLLYQWGDESHAWNVIHTYIVDYLENVCAHRMTKIYHNPAQQTQQSVPEPGPEPARHPVFTAEKTDEPVSETMGGYYELPGEEGLRFSGKMQRQQVSSAEYPGAVKEQRRQAVQPENAVQEIQRNTKASQEQRREAAREKVREAVLRTDESDRTDESSLAIQLDEARKNMEKAEKDSEERKIIIREILEQYLA